MSENQPVITFILATRSGATAYQGPLKLLLELQKNVKDPRCIEVIIRGDLDDLNLESTIERVNEYKFPFAIHWVKKERGRGYEDLHHFFHDCLLVSSIHKKLLVVIPEDINIKMPGLDQLLLNEYQKAKSQFGHSIFTMQQTLSPGFCSTYEETIENPDAFQIYTQTWIDAIGFGQVFSIDSWLQGVHHFLLKDFGLHLKYFLSQPIFERLAGENDHIGCNRWVNGRLRSHDYLRSFSVKRMIANHAKIISRLVTCERQNNAINFLKEATSHYGTASVLYKTMYFIFQKADKGLITLLSQQTDELAKKYYTLKKVASNAQSRPDIYIPINNDARYLYQYPFSYGQPFLSETEIPSSNQYWYSKKIKLLLKRTALIKIVYHYIKFKSDQRPKFTQNATAAKLDNFKEMMPRLFWSVRLKPLIKLIVKSKFQKIPK